MDDFLNKAGKTLSEAGKTIAQAGKTVFNKTKEMIDIAKVRKEITDSEKAINEAYLEIGRKVYENAAEFQNAEIAEAVQKISELKLRVLTLENEIVEIQKQTQKALEETVAEESAETEKPAPVEEPVTEEPGFEWPEKEKGEE